MLTPSALPDEPVRVIELSEDEADPAEVLVELLQALGERVDASVAPDLQLDGLALQLLFARGVGEGPFDQEIDAAAAEGEVELREGETLEELKARMKPKKKGISADLLDTANSYDDKVTVVRMLVSQDSKRVALVLKNLIGRDLS